MFVEYLPSLISIAGIVLVSVISPGPDFAVVVKNSLIYSRKTALLTALGIALGVLVHVTYSLLGLGFIVSGSPWILFCLKCLGASYLVYIGIKGLLAKKMTSSISEVNHIRDISALAAIRTGFFTNALNPKCMLFFVSLFSIVVDPNTPLSILLAYGAIMFAETLIWFSFVAFCLSGQQTRQKFTAVGHWVERVTGGILVTLGTRLFLSV